MHRIKKLDNVLVYIPLDEYGGTEILFCRLINFLAKKYNVNIYTGKTSNPNFIFDRNITVLTSKESLLTSNYKIVISSAKYLIDLAGLSKFINFKKLLLWQLHPDELCSPAFKYIGELKTLGKGYKFSRLFFLNLFYFKRKRKFKKLLTLLDDTNSLFMMDGSCEKSNSSWLNLNKKSKKSFLPVGVYIDNKINIKCNTLVDVVNIGVVSRISYDFKYYPILNVLQNFKKISEKTNQKILIHIVGNGEALINLMADAEELKSEKFKVIFLGFVPVESLRNDFYPKIDLAIGMGTSLLDASAIGIATISTNFYSKYLDPNKVRYNWIYKQKEFSLGEEYNYSNNGERLGDIFKDFIKNPDYHSKNSFEYVSENHDLLKVFNKIESIINDIDDSSPKNNILQYAQNVFKINTNSEIIINAVYKYIKKKKAEIVG